MLTEEERASWDERPKTEPFVRVDYDDEDQVCSRPGCGRHHFDDGAPLMDFAIVCAPGEEGYSEVSQLLCMEHSTDMVLALRALGFASHNHHGTCTLDAEVCGGYGRCLTPAEYGPELVRPENSTFSGARLPAYEMTLKIIAGGSATGDPVVLAQEVLNLWPPG